MSEGTIQPFFEWQAGVIYHGDARSVLPHLDTESVDAIVTDPPYELRFMEKAWDSTGVSYDANLWRECLRVLKPGGYLLAFGGSRTYHRMACAVEDAGFEIRDQIMWLYGSGFPKSLDVSKAIDKAARGVPQGGADPTIANHGKFKSGCSEENPSGRGFGAGPGQFMAEVGEKVERELVTEAKQWQGWGTALKPAHEPIVVARKPLEGTVAANVLKWGTGAINVDGCRAEYLSEADKQSATPQGVCTAKSGALAGGGQYDGERTAFDRPEQKGRWPANVIHDGSEEVLEAFARYGHDKGAAAQVTTRNADKFRNIYSNFSGSDERAPFYGDAGSAARFFYCAKATREDRDRGCESLDKAPLYWSSGTESPGTFQSAGTERSARNNHPTVKPTDLMRYLCRLVTPPGGVVLDPLMGSGSTGKAANLEGLRFIGIELELRTCQIAERRTREMTFLWPADSSAAGGERAEE